MSDKIALCGWRNNPDAVKAVLDTLPRPRLKAFRQGGWDGRTNVCLWDAAIRATGANLPAHNQNRGTCVSHGWSAGCDYLSCVEIAQLGMSLEYDPISHACVYGMAKEIGNDLSSEDGAVGAWAAKAVSTCGVVRNSDVEDTDTDDALAVKWGAHGVPADVKALAKPHLVKTVSLVTSFQAAADALANGYPVAVCSNQGFSDTRDSQGFCFPHGVWNHCMLFIGVVNISGRRGLVCLQSWGQNTPGGPVVLGTAPDNSFGVDAHTADQMLSQQDSFALSAFDGFPSRKLNWLI